MSKLDEITLGDLGQACARYQPFIAVGAAVALVVAFLPGDAGGGDAASVASRRRRRSLDIGAGDGRRRPPVRRRRPPAAAPAPARRPGAGSGAAAAAPAAAARAPAARPAAGAAPGRRRSPTATRRPAASWSRPIYAPPCVPAFSGDNGGATYQGVTDDTIKVVVLPGRERPRRRRRAHRGRRQQHARGAAGDDQGLRRLLQRPLRDCTAARSSSCIVEGSGDADDDAVGQADAIEIATEDQGVRGRSARRHQHVRRRAGRPQVICICTVSQPQEFYERLAPVRRLHDADGVDPGLHPPRRVHRQAARRPQGQCAGTATALPMQHQDRKFGLLYYETADNAYKLRRRLLREGAEDSTASRSPSRLRTPDRRLATAQEQARPLIQQLKQRGRHAASSSPATRSRRRSSPRRRPASRTSPSGSSPARRSPTPRSSPAPTTRSSGHRRSASRS